MSIAQEFLGGTRSVGSRSDRLNLGGSMLSGWRRRLGIGAIGVVMLAMAGCSTGAYPLDIFHEMHYQHSFRSLESPVIMPPSDSVPTVGRAPQYTEEQAASVENPVQATAEDLERASEIFQLNCVACHGPEGQGNGIIAGYFERADVAKPADYTSDDIRGRTDGQLYYAITSGTGLMPRFGPLLNEEDRWLLVHHIRELQK